MKKGILIACLLVAGIGMMAAEEQIPQVTVTGTATTKVTPDKMLWSLSVQNKGPVLKDVAKEHSAIVEKVLTFLEANKIDKNSIQTDNMAFGENWVYKNRSRVKEGYTASTTVSFVVKDFKKYQSIWEGLSEIPEVSVSPVTYDHTDRIKIRNETRVKALLAAKEKASVMAGTLGMRITTPLYINENSTTIWAGSNFSNNINALAAPSSSGSGTDSLAPGKIRIEASVQVSYRIFVK